MPKTPKIILDQVEGYGWVGRWDDGTLGWFLPTSLNIGSNIPQNFDVPQDDDELSYCVITLEQKFDKKGRPIRRKYKHLK